MKRFASMALLMLALVCGIAASFVTYRLLQNRQIGEVPTSADVKPTASVVVAKTPLTFGTVLQPAHLKSVPWPATPPRGSFAEPDGLVGRAVIVELVPDEPILASKLAPADGQGGLSAVIPRGKRAMSVRVNEIIGVAGFVLPRTRVDVLVSVLEQGDKSKAASKLILQNVEVLAAGQEVETDEEGKPVTVNVITLLVGPDEAEKLTLASTQGDLQLALRNSLDVEEVKTPGQVLGHMVHPAPPAKKVYRSSSRTRSAPKKPETQSVEVIRGSQRTVEKFQ